ncbi:MAG: SPFH domain-containing protein [Betaproteobacteria bacterium]|nr:SPFH domain-containing protein [Betaproteobacteria bacterium]
MADTSIRSHERAASSRSGYPMAALGIALVLMVPVVAITAARGAMPLLIAVPFVAAAGILLLVGLYMLQPNEAANLTLFGAYRGTDRSDGLRWANPLVRKRRLSLRSRNLNVAPLKVNDLRGNPVEIGAVVVWRVRDTAQAAYDVDDFENYVKVQAEAAIRHLASSYAYDDGEDLPAGSHTLRGGMEAVSAALREELQARFDAAGVEVQDAKLSHLAYAPEIAQVMLRRQQAEAIVSARHKIVQGAVGMVEAALQGLSERNVVHLDDERKASMVSNLLVVLCSDRETQPVVNTGTLYT